jgi:hypothetical protein
VDSVVADGVVSAAVSAVAEWAVAVVSAPGELSECRHYREAHFCNFECSVNFRLCRVRRDGLKQVNKRGPKCLK